GVGEGENHEPEMLGQGGLLVILKDTLFTSDALPDKAHFRMTVRRLVARSPMGLGYRCEPSLKGAHLEPHRAVGKVIGDSVRPRRQGFAAVLCAPADEISPVGSVSLPGIGCLCLTNELAGPGACHFETGESLRGGRGR